MAKLSDNERKLLKELRNLLELEVAIRWSVKHQENDIRRLRQIQDDLHLEVERNEFLPIEAQWIAEAVFDASQFGNMDYLVQCASQFIHTPNISNLIENIYNIYFDEIFSSQV